MELLDDDAVTLILLKLDLESLIRTTACCKRWLSLVCSNIMFISQYKALHSPVLGCATYDRDGQAWGCVFGAGKHQLVHVNLPLTDFWGWKDVVFSNHLLYFYNEEKLEVHRMVGSGWEKGLQIQRQRQGSGVFEFWDAEMGQPSMLDLEHLHRLDYWLLGMKLYVEVEEEAAEDDNLHAENEEGNDPKICIKAYDLSTGADLGVRLPRLPHQGAEMGLFETKDKKLMAVTTKVHATPHVEVYVLQNRDWRKVVEMNYGFAVRGYQFIWPVGATEEHIVVEVEEELATYDMVKQIWTKVNPVVKVLKPFIVDYLELFEARTLAKLGTFAKVGPR